MQTNLIGGQARVIGVREHARSGRMVLLEVHAGRWPSYRVARPAAAARGLAPGAVLPVLVDTTEPRRVTFA